MRILYIILAILLGLILLIGVIGFFLPVGHSATIRAAIKAPAKLVYDTLLDWQAFPEWRSGVTSTEKLEVESGNPAWTEVSSFGPLPMEVTERAPPHRIVGRIATEDLPFRGTWTWTIEDIGDGRSTVTITEDGEVTNPFFRFMSRLIFGHHKTMEVYLRDLGKKFGAEVTPVRVKD